MMKTNIFSYTDLNNYLNDFLHSKGNNSAFSFRSIALRLNVVSHSQLYQIVKGKKRFPLVLVQEMSSQILKLNRQEKRYFKALVEINHFIFDGASKKVLQDAIEKLEGLRPLEIKHIDFNEIMARPITMAIFELTGRRDLYKKQLKKDLFIHETSQDKIDEGIQFLVDSGHVKIDEDGKITRLVNHLMSSDDIPSVHIKNYHKEVSLYASHVINVASVEQREFQSYAINISKKNLPIAQEMIRNFAIEFARAMEAKEMESDSTYNLNLQFFPLIKDLT